jgi:hypothetical protein
VQPKHPVSHHTFSLFSSLFLIATVQAQDWASTLPGKGTGTSHQAVDWKKNTISPVADMMEFEDPIIRTELRPVFMYQNMDNDYVTKGGYAMLAGVQMRLALTDRFAIMATKGGYMDVKPGVGADAGGWGNLTGGFKYALVDDPQVEFILTGGLTYTAPSGSRSISHGTGSGLLAPFVSFEKGWGDFHLMGTLVYSQALDTDANSSILHYGLNADYYLSQWFIPFLSAVAWTVMDAGSAVELDLEGYDAVNFGSAGSGGSTQAVLGVGFRTRFSQKFDIGFAYQKSVVTPRGLFYDRITVDCAIRF